MLKELSMEKDMVDLLKARRLTYFGHVSRMGNDRFPKMLLHGHTSVKRKTKKGMAREYLRGL